MPRLNIILTLICRQYFADREMYYLADEVTPVMPILIGSPNPQCHNPEVNGVSPRLCFRHLLKSEYADTIDGIEVCVVH